jgi:hypothetical protein
MAPKAPKRNASPLALIQERFRSSKPLPDRNWFALAGAIDRPEHRPFWIGAGPLVSCASAGEWRVSSACERCKIILLE